MMTVLSPLRIRLFVTMSAGALALAGALSLQHVLGWLPCALCSLQRIGVLGLIAGGTFAAFAKPRMHEAGRVLASIGALLGLAFALQHLWLLWGPPATTCGDGLRHFVDQLVQALPGSQWLLAGVVPCEDATNALLGLPLPAWVSGLCVASLALLWARPRAS